MSYDGLMRFEGRDVAAIAFAVGGCVAACEPSPTVIASNQQPQSIAVDATNVYWTSLYGVFSAPKDGQDVTPTKLASVDTNVTFLTGIAVDDAAVYWADSGSCMGNGPTDGAIMNVPIGGGVPVTLADQQCAPQGIALDADTVYWSSATSVLKIPKSGGVLDAVALEETAPLAVAVDATAVYWGGVTGLVRSASKAAGSATTLANAQGLVSGVAIDSTSVYFAEFNGAPGALMKVAAGGGAPTTLATDDYEPKWIAVDDEQVYWTNNTQIRRATLDGASSETLVDNEFYPTALAVDDAYVYWGDMSSGDGVASIKRIAK